MKKLDKKLFYMIISDLNEGISIKDIAAYWLVSESQVRRIKEAGTWDRWPYMVAKSQHGYMTPEYKAYLKRRKLPIKPPAKIDYANYRISFSVGNTKIKLSLFKRFKAWIRSLR